MNRLLLALVSVAHFLPHPAGVSPIGAMAVYAGANGPRYTAWLVPLLPLFVSHLVFGFYEPVVLVSVYLGFALCTVVARLGLRRTRTLTRFGGTIAVQAVVFFLVSNFGNWLAFWQPWTAAGLLQCYINGLPYLGIAMLADAAYCFVLFGLHDAIARRQPEPVVT